VTLSVERGMLVMWPAFVTAACCEIRFQLIGRLFDGNAFSIALVVLAVPVVEAICALALFVATDAVDGWKLLWILFVAAQHAAWLVGYCFFYAMESLDSGGLKSTHDADVPVHRPARFTLLSKVAYPTC